MQIGHIGHHFEGDSLFQSFVSITAYCFPIPNRIKVKNKNILWHEEGIVSDNIVVSRWYYMSFFE